LGTVITPQAGARGISFGEAALTPSQFVAIARPYGENKYDLLILYQIPQQKPCWREMGENPTLVEPLLLNFDFTGICERSTDSNGYSLRLDQQDYGLDYLLRIVERNGELLLVGTPRTAKVQGEYIIGRTGGLAPGFLKINLEPGWRFTKRTYQGKELAHVYLSGDSQAIKSTPQPNNTASITPKPPTNNVLVFTAPTTPTTPARPVTPPPPVMTPNSLPPLPPPPGANLAVVPPPPRGARKNLGDVLGSLNGTNPPPANPVPSKGFRVVAQTQNSQQQSQLRSLYPDAFRTSLNGRSVWQVGVFSTEEKANQVLQSLTRAGLSGNVVAF
jgi:hypothetical protein